MLTHPTLDLLHKLGLHGMAKGFKRQSEVNGLAHSEWLALLLEHGSHSADLRSWQAFDGRSRPRLHSICL